jgi:hypothetical protein
VTVRGYPGAAAEVHRLESGRYLYRGFVIERREGQDSVWWEFDTDIPRGQPSLHEACRVIDALYRAGFMHWNEGVMGTFARSMLDECPWWELA